jgi:hypothetical protein
VSDISNGESSTSVTMGLTKLTVELYDAAPDSKKLADTIDHVPFIIAGLKTLLETGTPLVA